MTIKFVYNKAKGSVAVKISHLQQRKYKTLFSCDVADWDERTESVLDTHPDFEILAPRMLQMKLQARKIIASGIVDPDEALRLLLNTHSDVLLWTDFVQNYIAELKSEAAAHEKNGNLTKRNNINGNIRVYNNVLNRLIEFNPKLTINAVSYSDLIKFRQQREMVGNSRSTIHLYLRTLRSLYNRAIKTYNLPDNSPFDGVFKNLKIKSYESQKKYIDKESVRKLENAEHYNFSVSKYTDLWLLQFYFAGADLIDIYFLKKKQIRNGRVYFERGKTGVFVDLLIADKAQKIIDKWADNTSSEWLFPWRKDSDGYSTFSQRMYKNLRKIQQRETIEVLPAGGYLAVKVARHTFATLAKRQGLDSDLLRELMGHERDDIDNYYKDRYPQDVRDKALLEIINVNDL